MRAIGLVYDLTYALVDIKCGESDEVEEMIKTVLHGKGGIGVKIVCDSKGECRAKVITLGNSGFKIKEYVVDGNEVIVSSIGKCFEERAKLTQILYDVYRGGTIERSWRTLKSLREFLLGI